jgi:two-component system chemotaxis sensor kinase CheA
MRPGRESHDQPEFRTEAEEILEALGRDLQEAEGRYRDGGVPARMVNALFRHVHSLKGLSAMFGRELLSGLAHRLEDYLDRLRLGGIPVNEGALDLLFDAHEQLEALVAHDHPDMEPIQAVRERLDDALGTAQRGSGAVSAASLDPEMLHSLTHYEESRLQENLRQGKAISIVGVSLPMASFDAELRTIHEALDGIGEVISTLPSYSAEEVSDRLAFRLLVGTTVPESRLREVAGGAATVQRLDTAGDGPEGGSPAAPDPETGAEAEDGEAAAAGRKISFREEEEARDQARSGGSSVRVDLERLDRIMNAVGELILSRRTLETVAGALMAEDTTQGLGRELSRGIRDLDKKLEDLQRSVVGARMVPVSQLVSRLSRQVRKLSRQAGKEVTLEASGGRTELDKVLIDRLQSPLIHLIRNAIDHGLEGPDERRGAGKPPAGRLRFEAAQRGSAVVLTLADDGRGVSVDAVRQVAVARGLLEPGAALDLEAACRLVFEPGFSSARGVDEVSGRGFGLDVVQEEIAAINGEVRLKSAAGQGTTVEIELPITLAIIQCMLVRAAGAEFAIPVSAVVETLRFRPHRLESVARQPVLRLRGETLPLLDLGDFFHLLSDRNSAPEFVVVTRSGDRTLALAVDGLLGQHEVVIKPIDRRLEKIPGLAGATELGDNRAALVMDVTSLSAAALGCGGAA